MAHCGEAGGWYTNDKLTEAQPEAIDGKWFSWGTNGKADISDRWPTVTPQLANVGRTILCYMGSMDAKRDFILELHLKSKRNCKIFKNLKYLNVLKRLIERKLKHSKEIASVEIRHNG